MQVDRTSAVSRDKYQNDTLDRKETNTKNQIETIIIGKPTHAVIGIEEALQFTKYGKFNYILIAVTGIALAAVLIEMIGISFVFPVSECDLMLSSTDKGVLSGVGFVGIIIASFLWGYLADTRGRKTVMQWTLLLAFIASVLSSFAIDFWSLLVFRFLTGFFISGAYGPVFAYIGEFHTEKNRSKVIIYASVILGIFTLVLPLVAWLVINHNWSLVFPVINFTYKPWRLFIVGCSLLSLVASLMFFFLPESPKFVLGQGDQQEAINIIKLVHRLNCGKHAEMPFISELYDETALAYEQKDNTPKSLFASVWCQTKPLFTSPYLKTTVLLCVLKFIEFAGTNGVYMWIPGILNRLATNEINQPGERIEMCEIVHRYRPNITLTDTGIIFSPESCNSKFEIATYEQTLLLEVFYTLSFVIQGILINKVGKFPLLFGVTVLSTIFSISAAYVKIPKLAAYFYMCQILIGTTDSILNAVIVELNPTNVRATAMAVGSMFGRLGSVTFAYVLGLLVDYHCKEAIVSTAMMFSNTKNQIKTIIIEKPTHAVIGIEEALQFTKYGKFNYILIAVTGIALAAVLIETMDISFVLPVSECDLMLNSTDKGVLSGVGFVGIIIASFLWGYLADTRGRKTVMQWTLLLAFIASVLSSFAIDFWSLLVFRFLTGFFISGAYGPVFAYIGEFHTEQNRSKVIIYASVILGIFTLVLPLVAWLVINQNWSLVFPIINVTYKPWRLFIVGCSLLSLVASLMFFFLPESPKFVLGQGDQQEAINIIKLVHRLNCGKHAEMPFISELYDETALANEQKDNTPKSLFASVWCQTKPLFTSPYLKTTVLLCVLKFIEFGGTNGVYMWTPGILNRLATNEINQPGERIEMCEIVHRYRPNITLTDTGIIFSPESCNSKFEIATYEQTLLLEVFYTLSFVIQGILINKVGKFPLLFGVTVLSTIFSISAAYVKIPKLAAYFYMCQILMGTTDSILNAVIVELYPTNVRATAMAVGSMFGRLGSVTFAYVLGLLVDYHCKEAIVSTAIMFSICAFLQIFIPKIHKSAKKDTTK